MNNLLPIRNIRKESSDSMGTNGKFLVYLIYCKACCGCYIVGRKQQLHHIQNTKANHQTGFPIIVIYSVVCILLMNMENHNLAKKESHAPEEEEDVDVDKEVLSDDMC